MLTTTLAVELKAENILQVTDAKRTSLMAYAIAISSAQGTKCGVKKKS